MSEAAALAREIAPHLSAVVDEATGADMLANADTWEKAELTYMNNAAQDKAVKTTDIGGRAQHHLWQGLVGKSPRRLCHRRRFATDAIAKARADGDAAGAAIADFYLERGRAQRKLTWEEVAAEALIRVTKAVIADAVPTGDRDTDFVMAETSVLLVSTDQPDAGLGFARAR